MYLVHVSGSCIWFMYLVHVFGSCIWFMYRVHVSGASVWCKCLVHASGACLAYVLNINCLIFLFELLLHVCNI